MESLKRSRTDEAESDIREAVLIKIDTKDHIYIDKDEFKIGRAKDNDEIILDVMISRRHCIFTYEDLGVWSVKDLSSSGTYINNIAIIPGVMQKIYPGDIIQFSPNEIFTYVFTFAEKKQKKELEDKFDMKSKQQIEIKFQLKDLSQQSMSINNKENLIKETTILDSKIKTGNAQDLHYTYSQLLENERLCFKTRINEEKQKYKKILDISKQEKETLEIMVKEQIQKTKEEQTKWKNMMENKIKEEKVIQNQLLHEKSILEQKLKETEKTLKEREIRAETSQAILNANTTIKSNTSLRDDDILIESVNVDETSELYILDTIDLSELSQDVIENNTKRSAFETVNDIMDEQLACSICSELFVTATTLNCTHTFCHYCINLWQKKRRKCPICRKSIISMNRSLVIDNFIENIIENLSVEFKNRRKELIQERKNKRTLT